MPTARTAKIGDNNPPTTAQLLKEKHKATFDKAKNWVAKAKKADLAPKTLDDCAKLEALFGEGRDLANDADRIRVKEKAEPFELCNQIDRLFNSEIRDVVGAEEKKPGLARKILAAASKKRLEITRAEQAKASAAADVARKEADRLAEVAQRQEAAGKVRQADVTTAKVQGLDQAAASLDAQAAAPVAQASKAYIAGGRSVTVNAELKCTGVVRANLDLDTLRPYFKQEHLVEAVNAALKMKAFEELPGAIIEEIAKGRVR